VSSATLKKLRIHDNPAQTHLSNAQKQFNKLSQKIAAQKQLLSAWQDTIPRYNQLLSSKYRPLLDSYNKQRSELVYLLDNAYHDKHFKKADKSKIQSIIIDLSLDLIAGHGKDELKELYNRHSDSDFDADNQAQAAEVLQAMKAALKKMYGVEISDDDDVSSQEKMQAVLEEKLKEQQFKKANPAVETKAQTSEQQEVEARLQAEQENLKKSIQTVFRQLVAVLHPDREPDENERERKTALMQQVNVAYGKKDLLRLLELQLEVEQIDQHHLDNIAEQRLHYFNKLLQEQAAELQAEIAEITQGFTQQRNTKSSPEKVLEGLQMEIRNMQHNVSRLKTEIRALQSPAALKNWLKAYR
jgi:hypothetical protein